MSCWGQEPNKKRNILSKPKEFGNVIYAHNLHVGITISGLSCPDCDPMQTTILLDNKKKKFVHEYKFFFKPANQNECTRRLSYDFL